MTIPQRLSCVGAAPDFFFSQGVIDPNGAPVTNLQLSIRYIYSVALTYRKVGKGQRLWFSLHFLPNMITGFNDSVVPLQCRCWLLWLCSLMKWCNAHIASGQFFPRGLCIGPHYFCAMRHSGQKAVKKKNFFQLFDRTLCGCQMLQITRASGCITH